MQQDPDTPWPPVVGETVRVVKRKRLATVLDVRPGVDGPAFFVEVCTQEGREAPAGAHAPQRDIFRRDELAPVPPSSG